MKTNAFRVPLWSRYDPKTGLCDGECRRMPWGLDAEKIGGTSSRPLVRVWWDTRWWYGWVWK